MSVPLVVDITVASVADTVAILALPLAISAVALTTSPVTARLRL